jgi:integrase
MLTDIQCKAAVCPPDKARIRLSDTGSLYLEVAPNGSKRWFWKYRFFGKEKRLALGSYPAVPLKSARTARDAARVVLDAGEDPTLKRRVERLVRTEAVATTYQAVARELHKLKQPDWSEAHAATWLRSQEKDLFPWIGAMPIADVTAPLLLAALRRIEARGSTQMAHDVREYAGQVFSYGIRTARCKTNPARELIGALKTHVVRHHAALTDPKEIRRFLLVAPHYTGQPTTTAALLLSALLFQRPGNMRSMEWSWVDLDAGMLTIPSGDMKRRKYGKLNGRPHLVPLARQAVEILREVQPLTGGGRYVFASARGKEKPMSNNTMNAAMRTLGFTGEEMTAQGFRAMARTVIVEQIPGVDPEVIEAQLAHKKAGANGEAYDRAEYLVLRRQLMQVWADYLDGLRAA